MVSITKGAHGPNHVQLSYQLIRNVTAPEEREAGVQTYIANVGAFEIDKLDTRDNLRSYIAEHSARKRNAVHRAIERTIQFEPDRFINRNSGITVACSDVRLDDSKRVIHLQDASLINGSQTQGEIRRHMKELLDLETGKLPEDIPFHIRVEIHVDPSHASVIETAIARNTATAVASISQAGARGILADLQRSIATRMPNTRIRMSETDQDVLDTLQILQYTRLLMPASLSGTKSASEKLRAYKNKAQCLSHFADWHGTRKSDPHAKEKYDFTVEFAPHAIREFEYWQQHPGWNGHQIWATTKKGGRAVRRDKQKNITWVSPGIVFPLVSGLSAFVIRRPRKGWVIDKPDLFTPDEMIRRAVEQFRAHNSNPMDMGRSEAAYDALRIYPETLVAVMEAAARAKSVN
ncbi:MAG: AIPR family protein [Gammaproteobacteria bacterium]|nr:AIPR family protein [Gammaproteobacteria bacterium]